MQQTLPVMLSTRYVQSFDSGRQIALHMHSINFDYSSLGIHAESHGNCVIGGIQLYMSI